MWATLVSKVSLSLLVMLVIVSSSQILLQLLWAAQPGFMVSTSLENSRNLRNSRENIWRTSIHIGNRSSSNREFISPLLLQSASPWSREFDIGNYTTYTATTTLNKTRDDLKRAEEISLLVDEHEDNLENRIAGSFMNNVSTMQRKTKEETKTRRRRMVMDQIMNDMGVWNKLGLQKDEPSFSSGGIGHGGYKFSGDSTLSTVKIIPDEHHVSAFLNKGIVKRFLFLNDKFGNPLSITITPCTSILLWNVKFWPVLENGTQLPETVKTYRTQRTVTFTEPSARRGVYSIDIRPLHWDSYVHFYATSFHSKPIRVFPFQGDKDEFVKNYISPSDFSFPQNKPTFFHENRDKFYQHMFTQADTLTNYKSDLKPKVAKKSLDNSQLNNPMNFLSSSAEDHQTNTNADGNNPDITKPSSMGNTNKPRIWVKRLRGNRLQVKWDASPINPHIMNYCIVVNTRRDYNSLCSASGERYGVLPPDLMHVAYYGSSSENNNVVMMDNNNVQHFSERHFSNDDPSGAPHKEHKLRHQKHLHRETSRRTRATHDDIVLGCVNKKTNYILNNLNEGRLYYFNVFLRDLSTNVSYPYLRTTLKYETPKNIPNGLRDAKPTKIKLVNSETGKSSDKPTVVKFNLNKPCNELTLYVMPCGGGSIQYEAFHGNKSVYLSGEIDSLDIIKMELPQKGKYYIKISQASEGQSQARMVEVFVGKKKKKFPLPKMPEITKLFEDESLRNCDSVVIQWWPSPDPRDNEYCIFLKEENRKRVFNFKKPNQCDVERSLKSDPYVNYSLCLQRTLTPETMMVHQKLVGLQPKTVYVIQLIVRRHNGKALSYDLHHVKTLEKCIET